MTAPSSPKCARCGASEGKHHDISFDLSLCVDEVHPKHYFIPPAERLKAAKADLRDAERAYQESERATLKLYNRWMNAYGKVVAEVEMAAERKVRAVEAEP